MLVRLRDVCSALPEAGEAPAAPGWPGRELKVHRRVFARVFAMPDPVGDDVTMLVCQVDRDEREALLAAGHPFFATSSSFNRIGVVLDDDTDWDEVGELVTDAYRLVAPKRLAALLEQPPA